MKLDCRLAKTIMENEEGLNHLWIQFSHDLFDYKVLQIKVKLPDGIYRLPTRKVSNRLLSRKRYDNEPYTVRS
jgi:hypothetical protein